MALAASLYEVRVDATNNNGGGGFNTNNANMPTDLAATSATGNAAVLTSATFTFTASEDENWIYVKSGTNWTPGFYQIASVSGGAATLRCAIGEAVQYNATTDMWGPNTVAGCATTASPTGGTFTMDYSQRDSGIITSGTDGTSTASTTFTSALQTFSPVMVGNFLHLISGTGTTAGWYEIVQYTDAHTLVLDRASGTYTLGVFVIGGAVALGDTLDDDIFELAVAGSLYYVKSCNALGEAVSIAAAGTAAAINKIIGYATLRGDNPVGTTRPVIRCGSNAFTTGSFWSTRGVIFTGTSATGFSPGAHNRVIDVKSLNNSVTADRNAISPNAAGGLYISVEAISYRGRAINGSLLLNVFLGCYFHSSNQLFRLTSTSNTVALDFCILADAIANHLILTAANTGICTVKNTLFYGMENKKSDGINLATGVTNFDVMNSIFYGLTNGIVHADTQNICYGDFNDYFNNTTDVTKWFKGAHDLALDPQFTSVTQITGTAGKFAAGNVTLQDSTKDFSALGVIASSPPTHYVGIFSGTGVTAGYAGITSITTTTNANDTLGLDIVVGTNTTADKVYSITIGNNFGIGTNLRAAATPGVFPGL